MANKRDTVIYELRDGRKKVYVGITNDPARREVEHKNDGKKFTKMTVTTPKLTEESAVAREKKAIETYQNNHKGEMPKYNKKK